MERASTIRQMTTLDGGLPRPSLIVAIGLPTVLITVSEIFVFFDQPYYGLWGHFVTLFVCVLAPLKFKDDVWVYQAFALLPTFRLVNLGMPIFFELTLFWYPLVYGPLIPVAAYVATRHDKVSPFTGWRLAVLAFPAAILLSGGLSIIEYRIIEPGSLIRAGNLTQLVLLFIVQTVFVGFTEELVYRGILQRTLKSVTGVTGALLIANFLFGIMHSAYGTPRELVFAGLLGILYSLIYERTDSLLLVTLLHGLLNTFLFGIYPLYGVPYDLFATL